MIRILLLAILAAAPLAASTPLTLEDYVTMPQVGSPQLSPDGSRVAYLVTRADMKCSAYQTDLWMIGIDGSGNVQLTQSSSVSQPRFSPDGKAIAFLSDRDGTTSIYLLPLAGGEARKLTGDASIRGYKWSPDGRSIAFVRQDSAGADEERRKREKDDARVLGPTTRFVHLHVVDVESGEVRRITGGEFSIFSFSWSPDGKLLAIDRAPGGTTLDDQYRTDVYLVDADGKSEPRPLVVRPGIDRWATFSPDGRTIAFVSGGREGWLREHQIYLVPVSGGTPRLISSDYARTPQSLEWSEDGKVLWFDGPWDSTSQLFRLNADGSSFTNVSKVEGVIEESDVDTRRGRAVFVYETPTAPPEIYATDLARFAPRRLTDVTAAWRDRAIGETQVIHWKNPSDGMEVEGLLTLPVGYKAGRVPLLAFVHGGPASRFDQSFLGYFGFAYAPQVMASRGFAIFRPNPRGSGGYGEAFRGANLDDWGGKDWDDVNAGIDALVARGIADPARLGLMGWSYGGYLSAWAIGHGGERFRAISIGAPVVDLLSYHGTADLRDFIPTYFPRPMSLEFMRERSPLWTAKRIDAPVLIQQGENDERVPLGQGLMLYRRLQELGVDVTMVVYPRTAHAPREPKLRLDVGRRNVEFFEKYVSR